MINIKEKKYSIKDSVLDGFNFEELIFTVQLNEKDINKTTVEKTFNNILQAQVQEARNLFQQKLDYIVNDIKTEK